MDYKSYILSHFYSIYQVDDRIIEDLNSSNPKRISWPNYGDAFFEKSKPFELNAIEVNWLGKKIPLPFADKGDVITTKNKNSKLCFDVFAASFMILSGWQEFKQNDVGSRISAKHLFQYRYKCIRLPIVNYYLDILKTALEEAWEIEIPLKKKRSSVFISHDVVKVNGGWKNSIRSEASKFNLGNMVYLVARRLTGSDIWRNLDFIMSLEESYDVRSTFFLMGRRGKGYADYDLGKSPYNTWVKDIQGRGFEAALLASNGSHNSAHKLGSDMRHFKYKVYGNRFQELKYKTNSSPRSLEKNKFVYDHSMGMYDEVGFRNGYCYPFIPWNFKDNRMANYVEIPLMINDHALEKRKYLSVVPKDAQNAFIQIAEQSEKFNGIISINWSNYFYSDFGYKEWRKAMERIIKEGLDRGYSFKSGYQLSLAIKEKGLVS